MEKIIYYTPAESQTSTPPTYVKGRVVITNHHSNIASLFEAGAKHVFCGKNAEKEAKEFINRRNYEEFFDSYSTSDSHFHASILRALQGHSSKVPLLLLGESGVGKTHLAEKIHSFLNPTSPFISKNLCELSSQLIESELFGHVKGAFTGALQDKEGLLSLADGGTLFLDEIGSLPLEIQKKLLKVLEEGTFTPVGSLKERKISFNLITATCDDLKSLIEKGGFREDFYFRLCGEVITIPALRDRPNDIRFLLKSFQKDFSRQLFFSKEILDKVIDMPWKGNIRELYFFYSKLQRGPESYITELPLPLAPRRQKQEVKLEDGGLPELIGKFEDQFFEEAIQKHGNRPNRICQELKISKSVFYRLQEKFNLDRGLSPHHLAN